MNRHQQSNRRILVTGGAGYIGSHTCKALAQAGFEPVTFDNLSTGHRWAVKWGPFVEADLADTHAITRALTYFRPAAVIHFAGSAYVGESVTNPRKYFDNNVRTSLNLLNCMLDNGPRRIVFSSTCATYGIPEFTPINESHPQHPINAYGESKLFIERVLAWFGHAYGFRSLALRYFNAAGADPDSDLGEQHDPETHLIPLAIGAALGVLPPVKVFGADYGTDDGTCVRDYVHVSDLATAHVLAVRALDDCSSMRSVNLGTGVGASVKDVISAIASFSGHQVPYEIVSRRPGDPPTLVASSDAPHVLGWTPKYSELGAIIGTAWRWHASQRSMSRRPVGLPRDFTRAQSIVQHDGSTG